MIIPKPQKRRPRFRAAPSMPRPVSPRGRSRSQACSVPTPDGSTIGDDTYLCQVPPSRLDSEDRVVFVTNTQLCLCPTRAATGCAHLTFTYKGSRRLGLAPDGSRLTVAAPPSSAVLGTSSQLTWTGGGTVGKEEKGG